MALVVREPDPEQIGARVDWSAWYLTDEEDMGEGCEQGEIIRILLSCLGQLAAERGWQNVLIAGDNYFAWVKDQPLVRVSPDVYLLDEPPPPPLPKMWETWLPGRKPPRFAVEIVSDDWKKDYDDNPPKYAQLGCRELVIFDPEAVLKAERKGSRVPLQVYRRDEDGAFVNVYRGDGPVYCEEIGAHLAVRREGATVRLRVTRDAAGMNLVPTAEERAQVEAQARKTAEAEIERLRAEIEALRKR
jgi:Uma2 family endonuclease